MAQANARTVYVQPTTGGRLEVKLPSETSVSNLKMLVAKRLKVPKDKIVLLHKNKQLTEGSLDENNITEGSKLILLPNVETGLMTQNPEECVMQALESLNEAQVDLFLEGHIPLSLSMRLADHMMFIQLQLSTVALPSSSPSNSTSSSPPTPPSTPTSTTLPPSSSPFSSASSTSLSSSITALPSPPPSPQSTSPTSPNIMFHSPLSPQSNTVFKEASRNLTQTLTQLSSSALAKKMNESCDGRCCLARQQGGAVIESMFHHGRGVFSGTFTGTLNPTLQDLDGKPRRNIFTIIHILNDLLGASSHCNPSAQCLCSSVSPAQSKAQTPTPKNTKGVNNLNENKVLREKVHHIKTMLKEKRLNRTTRRSIRSSPYPCNSRGPISTDSNLSSKKIDSKGVFLSTMNTECDECDECDEQKLMDFSSETAAA